MSIINVTYASSPSGDLLIPTLEFNNEQAGVIRLAQSFNDVIATTELADGARFCALYEDALVLEAALMRRMINRLDARLKRIGGT